MKRRPAQKSKIELNMVGLRRLLARLPMIKIRSRPGNERRNTHKVCAALGVHPFLIRRLKRVKKVLVQFFFIHSLFFPQNSIMQVSEQNQYSAVASPHLTETLRCPTFSQVITQHPFLPSFVKIFPASGFWVIQSTPILSWFPRFFLSTNRYPLALTRERPA